MYRSREIKSEGHQAKKATDDFMHVPAWLILYHRGEHYRSIYARGLYGWCRISDDRWCSWQ